ncbi:hypothetical protein [Hyalangium sp.]|uniref:hypothetical protein n=1 Tax=Hyalangium sp. TaxID=2028555 RepID=UPI002D33B56A|nr:hypothetical protein [Hyalangium sp.]HYI01811.1 hypothetical protein [Hyalangium sp.]
MHLIENPFHLLGASPRDDRRRLLELAEERSLSQDPVLCTQARADLSNPRNRLAAEVAWLPGLDPAQASEAVEFVQRAASTVRTMTGIPALSKANLLAAALPRLEGTQMDSGLAIGILELATLMETCDAEQVRALINEERAVAGFPEVREVSAVAEALAERRRHYRTALKSALEVLPPLELVSLVTVVVTEATARGTRPAPGLIDDMVDAYEVEAQRFLDAEARNVELLVEAVRRSVAKQLPRAFLKRLLSRIEDVVTNWDMVAQPVQLSSMSRGLDHALSHRVALAVRELALELYNAHGLLEESKLLTALLQDAFGEVPRVAEVTSDDAQALQEIAQKREASRREWERAIAYEAELGTFQRHTVRISPAGIDWQGMRWPLEAISRIRWGGIADEEGGHPKFIITFGDGDSSATITTFDRLAYSSLLEKLWLAVCRRLLIETLITIAKGQKVVFGDVVLDDQGLVLPRRQGQWDSSAIYGTWNQLQFQTGNGSLVIRHQQDARIYAELPYLAVDNVHILETAIRNFSEHKTAVRLSDLLND